MEITIKNCNNVDAGKVTIVENSLNIKYGINGTGKSTISKAIEAFANNDKQLIDALLPFKYRADECDEKPSIEGIDNFKKIAIFNEDYTNKFVFNKSELIENSFEIFVKTDDYEKQLGIIDGLLVELSQSFQSQGELEELMTVCGKFIDGFGKTQSGISRASMISKSLRKGNILECIPQELEPFSGYLKSTDNLKWLKWQQDGMSYLEIVDNQCPYCTNNIEKQKGSILKVKDTFDTNTVNHLNNILSIFATLMPYFSEMTGNKVTEITSNVSAMTVEQEEFLLEIKKQISVFLNQLNKLKGLNFHSVKNIDKISEELLSYKIDLDLFAHLNSIKTKEKVDTINKSFDQVLENIGVLKGAIIQQKNLIKGTIEKNTKDINDFLLEAGYKYRVSIEESSNSSYQLVLKHEDAPETDLTTTRTSLSYGERNALSLILFMYGSLKDAPELIILDDPISSFDGNKKFAIISRLFRGKNSFQEKTVLLLTHEFNTVIDVIHNVPKHFTPIPKAHFLTTKSGVLEEVPILKDDIKLFKEIALSNMNTDINMLNKLVYLRRLLEIEGNKKIAWNILSSLFHKREFPTKRVFDKATNITRDVELSASEFKKGVEEIIEYIPEFNYIEVFKNTQDIEIMKQKYLNSQSNYEKLHIYRIIFNDNHDSIVIRKFVNETFHIENDSIFQLNPNKYDTIPQYVIDECNKAFLDE